MLYCLNSYCVHGMHDILFFILHIARNDALVVKLLYCFILFLVLNNCKYFEYMLCAIEENDIGH